MINVELSKDNSIIHNLIVLKMHVVNILSRLTQEQCIFITW